MPIYETNHKSVSNKILKHKTYNTTFTILYMVGNERYTRIVYIYQISKFMLEILIREIIFLWSTTRVISNLFLPFVQSINVWTVSNDYLELTECSLKLLIIKLKWIQENTFLLIGLLVWWHYLSCRFGYSEGGYPSDFKPQDLYKSDFMLFDTNLCHVW